MLRICEEFIGATEAYVPPCVVLDGVVPLCAVVDEVPSMLCRSDQV